MARAVAKLPVRRVDVVFDDVPFCDDDDDDDDDDDGVEVEHGVVFEVLAAAASMILVLTTSTGVVSTAAMAPAVPADRAVMSARSIMGEGVGIAEVALLSCLVLLLLLLLLRLWLCPVC